MDDDRLPDAAGRAGGTGNRWLRWWGHGSIMISASQMNQYTAVPHAKIIGGRFTFLPFQSLELGASRIMQWGGKGGLSHLVASGYFTGHDTGTDNEPVNQLVGFDLSSN